MTGREKKIVYAIAQGITAAQDMTAAERTAAIKAAFAGKLGGMRDYAVVAMCLLMQDDD